MNEQLENARRCYQMAPPALEQDAYDYMPAWLYPYIPGLYKQENEKDPVIWAKLFTPDSNWTWYITECKDTDCFGFVEGFEGEWGYFSLLEMSSARGPLGLKIERDLWWRPKLASQVIRQRAIV